MTEIHPTAIVDPNAKLGENVKVDAFAVIHGDVEIGEESYVGPHAVIYDGARIGKNVKIFQGASVSNEPQDLKFGNEKTYFYVGDNTQIREFVTLHRGTKETGFSRIGKNCLIMAYAHVAHDCVIGDNVILANGVQVAGHIEIDDYAILGGLTGIHQFSKIGKHVMISGISRVTLDVPPFIVAGKEPMKYQGLNVVGLRRRGFTAERISRIKEAYGILYSSPTVKEAIKILRDKFGDDEDVTEIVNFVERSKRGIVRK
jgi:UDP-N-acetylglucosamine acyltransferase